MQNLKTIRVHLISESNCDSLIYMMKDVSNRFKSKVSIKQYVWSFVDNEKLIRIINIVRKQNNSVVIYHVANLELRNILKKNCKTYNIPSVAAFAHLIKEMSCVFDIKPDDSGVEEFLSFREAYSSRIEAMNYVMSHDDGKQMWHLENADIIIVGASRTSKTPTSIYLSHQGYNVANIPYVLGIDIDEILRPFKNKFIVGFYIQIDRLFAIRKNRLMGLKSEKQTNYTSYESISKEIIESKKYFISQRWPIIDVTYKSVEEIAAQIIKAITFTKQ